jgi:hypothetical protein
MIGKDVRDISNLCALRHAIYISKLAQLLAAHMSEYESGTFRCRDCAKEFLTKEEADRHYREQHSEVLVGE